MIEGGSEPVRSAPQSEGPKNIGERAKNFLTKLPSFADIKSNKAGLERLGHTVLKSGGEKHVVIKAQPAIIVPRSSVGADQTPEAQRKPTVVYVAVRHYFISKANSLKREIRKMGVIEKRAQKAPDGCKNLAVEARVLQGEERLGGQFSVEVERATGGDFEETIRDKIPLEQRIGFSKDYLGGLAAMHRAGFAYGDAKPENCLIYNNSDGTSTLKIADFGKAEEVGAKGTRTYKGNLRFAPPEGKLSQKSDVYGAGLVLIRNLEESILLTQGTSLVAVAPQDQEAVPASDKRRGVEQFIVNHKAFPGLDEPTLGDKLFRRLPRQAMLQHIPSDQKAQQHAALCSYIDALCEQLPEEVTQDQRRDLNTLLKEMVATDPARRPKMYDVQARFSAIFP